MKILVAIPCYNCSVTAATSKALVGEAVLAQMLGISLEVAYQPGMSVVHAARNMLADLFLASNADKLFFVDADTGWEPGALITVAAHDVDVCAAGVRLKRRPEKYAINFLSGAEVRGDLLEICSIGMAFTCISRACLERFRELSPEFAYEQEGRKLHGFFESPIRGGRLLGEDIAFCQRWRGYGGKVWLDPTHRMIHADGVIQYEGCVGDWLKLRQQVAA